MHSTNQNSKSSLTTVTPQTLKFTSMIIFDIETNALKIEDITEIFCCGVNGGEDTALYKNLRIGYQF